MIIVNHPFYLPKWAYHLVRTCFCDKILIMKEYAIRLIEGQDLKQSIVKFAKENHIQCGVVVASVGCLKNLRVRNAGATEIISKNEDFEILSLNGTIADEGNVHLHLCVSDCNLNAYGGHLVDGNIVNTTVELVILELAEYSATRQFDNSTGYDEIVFERKKK